MKTYPCMFDDQVTVIEVEKTDSEYQQCLEVFNTGTHAFTILGTEVKAMIIDAEVIKEEWFTDDHMAIIQAHECGHIHNDSESEIEADFTGLKLIDDLGLTTAFSLYCQEIQYRYCNQTL